jgi:hypothetical protein
MLGAAAAISLSYQTEPVFLDLPPLSRINTLSSVSYSGGGRGSTDLYFVEVAAGQNINIYRLSLARDKTILLSTITLLS